MLHLRRLCLLLVMTIVPLGCGRADAPRTGPPGADEAPMELEIDISFDPPAADATEIEMPPPTETEPGEQD